MDHQTPFQNSVSEKLYHSINSLLDENDLSGFNGKYKLLGLVLSPTENINLNNGRIQWYKERDPIEYLGKYALDPFFPPFKAYCNSDNKLCPPFYMEDDKFACSLWCVPLFYNWTRNRLLKFHKKISSLQNNEYYSFQPIQTYLLQLTRSVLLVNCGHYTSLNIRKKCFLGIHNLVKRHQYLLKELEFFRFLFCKHPKIVESWEHYHWVFTQIIKIEKMEPTLQNSNTHLFNPEKEYLILTRIVKQYKRNYYAWSHRYYVVSQFPATLDLEITFAFVFLEKNYSDYSCLHHLYQLILMKTSMNASMKTAMKTAIASTTATTPTTQTTQTETNENLSDILILFHHWIGFLRHHILVFPASEALWYAFRYAVFFYTRYILHQTSKMPNSMTFPSYFGYFDCKSRDELDEQDSLEYLKSFDEFPLSWEILFNFIDYCSTSTFVEKFKLHKIFSLRTGIALIRFFMISRVFIKNTTCKSCPNFDFLGPTDLQTLYETDFLWSKSSHLLGAMKKHM